MHDEVTQVDIDKMKEELQHRIQVLRPQLIEEVKVARSFGDLSENFEYKAAKREKNRNDSRIRYLENMIKTAVVIDGTAAGDGVALFDKVTFYLEEEETEETIQLVTTLRQDALKGLISKESPVGKALLGHQVGDPGLHPCQRQLPLLRPDPKDRENRRGPGHSHQHFLKTASPLPGGTPGRGAFLGPVSPPYTLPKGPPGKRKGLLQRSPWANQPRNRYPTPQTVSMYWVRSGLSSILSRMCLMCTVTVETSP